MFHLGVRANGGHDDQKTKVDIQTCMLPLSMDECEALGLVSHVTTVDVAYAVADGELQLDGRYRTGIMMRIGAPDDPRGMGQAPSENKVNPQRCGICYSLLTKILQDGFQPMLGLDGHVCVRGIMSRENM